MTNWRRTIWIKQYLHRDDLSFEQRRDKITAVLKDDRAYLIGQDPDYQDIVDELAEAPTEYDFNLVLDALYDWADAEVVWIGPT